MSIRLGVTLLCSVRLSISVRVRVRMKMRMRVRVRGCLTFVTGKLGLVN
jgi:hypothetical protein